MEQNKYNFVYGETDAGAPTYHDPFGPSSMQRHDLCPISFKLEQMCDEPEASEDAKEGTRLHSIMATLVKSSRDIDRHLSEALPPNLDEYPREVQEAYTRMHLIYHGDSVEWPKDDQIFVETFMNLAGKNIESISKGTADIIIVRKDEVVVIDWKFGYNETVEASSNLQTAAYCIMAAQMFHKDTATAFIINPRFKQQPGFTFTKEYLDNALKVITDIKKKCLMADLEDPNAYNPGETQCKHCLGMLTGKCTRLYGILAKTKSQLMQDNKVIDLTTMSDEKLCKLYENCGFLEQLVKAIKGEIEGRCNTNGECGDYYIKEISGGFKISDIAAAFNEVKDFITFEQFIECCDVRLPALKTAVAKALKSMGVVRTQKDGEALLDAKIRPLMEPKASRKTLTLRKD